MTEKHIHGAQITDYDYVGQMMINAYCTMKAGSVQYTNEQNEDYIRRVAKRVRRIDNN